MASDLDFPPVPLALQFLIFGFMVAGVLWAGVVFTVNFPPQGWVRRGSAELDDDSRSATTNTCTGNNRRWCTRLRASWRLQTYDCSNHSKKAKPIDKPSRYARLPVSDSSPASSSPMSSSSGISLATISPQVSAYSLDHSDRVASLKRRRPGVLQSSPTSPWNTSCNSESTPNAAEAQSPHPPLFTSTPGTPTFPRSFPSSPLNPYLSVPAVLSRSSAEWLRARESFFANSTVESSTPSRLSSSAPQEQTAHLFDEAEDLEAQTAPLLGGARAEGKPDRREKRGSARWLDRVDEAVNRAVDRVARWTDDGGGDEGLLLPVAREA